MRVFLLHIGSWAIVILSHLDPFYYLNDTSITDSTEIREIGQSWYQLARSLAIAIVAITGVIAAAVFGLSKNSKKIREAKSSLVFKFVVIIFVFSAAFILSTLSEIFDSFVN